MPKPFTCPNLVDDCLTIRASTFTNSKFMREGELVCQYVWWNGSEGPRSKILIGTDDRTTLKARFQYTYYGEERDYWIPLVVVPSNLGLGNTYYFLCPRTNKRCRKLVLFDGWFMHRDAIPNAMYWNQTHSKRMREIGKLFDADSKGEKAMENIYSPYYKKTYAGNLTKRHKKNLKAIDFRHSVPFNPRDYLFGK